VSLFLSGVFPCLCWLCGFVCLHNSGGSYLDQERITGALSRCRPNRIISLQTDIGSPLLWSNNNCPKVWDSPPLRLPLSFY
jgi:hypothetical protein